MKKILCVCEGGNVRSVSMAFVLKHHHGQDALACGWRMAGPDTFEMLCNWAELIVVMEEYMEDKIPEAHKDKIIVVDVGPDRYGSPFHKELLNFVSNVGNDWASLNFDI